MLTSVALGASLPDLGHAAPGLRQVGSFDSPINVAAAPGDNHRLYVVERAGRVRLLKDGMRVSAPFLDLSEDVETAGEGGLISLAFPPDYSTSGLFYAYYTDATGIRIAEFRRSTNPDVADPASRRVLLTQPHSPSRNHYAGQLQFDSGGLLYVAIGDGDDGGRHAQDLSSLWGKILRIQPVGPGDSYAVPADNPFATDAVARAEIWAYGLRNPWRFSFDRRTGDLLIGDVGQGRADEVGFAPRSSGAGRGMNFGWNCFEGFQLYAAAPESCSTGAFQHLTPPLFELLLPAVMIGGWCRHSVIGGYVVRDRSLPSLHGRYLYGDFCSGAVRSVRPRSPGTDAGTGLELPPMKLVSFGEDARGRVYLVSLSGQVYLLEERPRER